MEKELLLEIINSLILTCKTHNNRLHFNTAYKLVPENIFICLGCVIKRREQKLNSWVNVRLVDGYIKFITYCNDCGIYLDTFYNINRVTILDDLERDIKTVNSLPEPSKTKYMKYELIVQFAKTLISEEYYLKGEPAKTLVKIILNLVLGLANYIDPTTPWEFVIPYVK